MLGVHLHVELEADSARPRLHELGQLSSAVFSLAQCLLLLDLTRCKVETGGHGEQRVGCGGGGHGQPGEGHGGPHKGHGPGSRAHQGAEQAQSLHLTG